jgi:hypothetical protein
VVADRGSRVIKALEQALSRRERERAPVRTSRVTGRNDDGTVLLQRSDAECVARGGVSDAYTGEVVLEPARSPFARRGTAGIAQAAEQGSVSILWVERLDPDRYRPGASYSVTVTGRGFTPATVFEFLRPGLAYVPNEGISITSSTFVDETTFLLEIDVAPTAALFRRGAPLAYDNPGDPL